MRISTSTLYDQGAASIDRAFEKLTQSQEQISSGVRVARPSDDPLAAAASIGVQQGQNLNAQYTSNASFAQARLGDEEGALGDLTTLLQNVHTRAIYAGNGSLTDSDRASLAIEVRQAYRQALAIANRADAGGQYLFAGYRSGAAPFSEVAPGNVTYAGDRGVRQVQIGSANFVAVGDPGSAVFGELFSTLNDLATALENGTGGAGTSAYQASIQGSLSKVGASLNDVLQVRSSVGLRLQQVSAAQTSIQSGDLQLARQLSALRDVDAVKAISDLNRQQLNLQAAEQSFVKATSLNLFSLL